MPEDMVYHDTAVLMTSIMHSDAWQRFLAHLDAKKSKVLAKLASNDTGIEIASVDKKDNDITIVVLNKDMLQHKLTFLKELESDFKGWIAEASKK